MSLADFGLGTVVGTLITAGVVIFLDQRRRKDEKKSRFLDDKRLGYKNAILALDMIASIQLLHAEFATLRKDIDGEPIPEEAKASGSIRTRILRIMRTFEHELDQEAIRGFSLLASRAWTTAMYKTLSVIDRMKEHVAACEFDRVGELADEYDRAAADLQAAARRDLGTD